MAMIDGMLTFATETLETKDEIASVLIDKGYEPKLALKISTDLALHQVRDLLERRIANCDAATITNAISESRLVLQ